MRSIFTLFFIFYMVRAIGANDSVLSSGTKNIETDFTNNKSQQVYRNQSILATGKWIRLSSDKPGIIKISYSRLSEFGILNPSIVAVYTNGGYMLPNLNSVYYPDDLTQIPIIHSKDKSGGNCIYFYSPGTTKWNFDAANNRFNHSINLFTDSTFFFLSSDVVASPEPISAEPISETPDTVLSSFVAHKYFEEENINLINSGNLWFSDKLIDLLRKSYNFSFPNAISSETAKITITSAARCTEKDPVMDVKINNSTSFSIGYSQSSTGDYASWAQYKESVFNVPSKENMTIDLTYNTDGAGGDAWLNYISLNVPSRLVFNGSQLDFRTNEVLNYDCIEFKITEANSNCLVWNINNPLNPYHITTSFNSTSKEMTLKDNSGNIGEFIIFDPVNGSFTEPHFSASLKNQNIHGLPSYEMVIVTHPDFIKESAELAEFHRQYDNMTVLVVTTDEVYNEFSSGLPDLSAIRNMFKLFYTKGKYSATPFKYAVLFGDGSYNNRLFDKSKNNNFIPTYQSTSSMSKGESYTTDDFYGWLGDDNRNDSLYIGIGRIPCKTALEAQYVINKITDYTKPKTLGDWRNNICFLADDEDNNQYMKNSEELNNLISQNYPGFFAKKIYFDAFQQFSTSGGFKYPDATIAINESVNEGALILNYIGHGNPQSMAHENVLLINDINSWKNSTALPLFITATCEFGRFDEEAVSAAEAILLNPSGGGIALFTTTRPVYSSDNQDLSINFFANIFAHDNTGEKLRLGDVMKNAKNSTMGSNKYSFTLLADPALRLAFPKYNVKTRTINDIDVNTTELTLGALDKVTIKGEVTNPANGNVLTNYSGEITTVIYDKVDTVETLANDGGNHFRFTVQNNVIYRGVSSVVNGEFELTFIVPKDISYNIGTGKIIYYTSNNENDGNGAISTFNIGGSGSNPVLDVDPPEIEMFMNNEDFKPYDKVSSSALLLVNLFDQSGINTVGTGIGHDLVAIIDGDYSNQIILNDSYSSMQNSYQEGKIIYPLSNLEPGEHKIWIRVWDVQNNSSEKEIHFIVEDGFKITAINNIPNPITSITDFVINHNLPGDLFDATINIYNLCGQKINTISELVSSAKTTTLKVRWNVFQSDYPVFPNQWLVYQVILKNQNGLTATGAGKLLISSKN